MNKLLYIGAGLDLVPVIYFEDIKEFIYIDSQPFSEFGTLTYDEVTEISKDVGKEDRFVNGFSRLLFIDNLCKIMKQIHFNLQEETDKYMLFQNSNQTVRYYYSCAFPEYIDDEIIDDIHDCDTIYMAGYSPHKDVFKYLSNPIYFIGNQHTVYNDEEDDDWMNSSFNYIHDNPTVFKKYYILKDLVEYEYWKHDLITNKIRDYHELKECKNLEDIISNLR